MIHNGSIEEDTALYWNKNYLSYANVCYIIQLFHLEKNVIGKNTVNNNFTKNASEMAIIFILHFIE